MNPTDIKMLIAYAANLWPRTFPAPDTEEDLAMTIQVWKDVLSDLDPQNVRAAMGAWKDHWPPSPQELRSATLSLVAKLNGAPTVPDPDEAFTEVLDLVKAIGYLGHPTYSHPAVEDAVRACGGWQEICASENLEALRAHFRQNYQSSSSRHATSSEPPIPAVAALMQERDRQLDGPQRIQIPEVSHG